MFKRIPTILFCVTLIASLCIGIYVRLYPLRTFKPHDTKEKATIFVISQLKEKVKNIVTIQYANLSDNEKIIAEKKLFNELLHTNRLKIQESIKAVSENIQANDPNAQKYPYLLASDSFYYLQLTKNILQTGQLSPKIKGSKYLNTLMAAPNGYWEPINLHPFIGVFVYSTAKLIQPEIPLDFAIGFTPLLIVGLTVLLFFIVLKNLQISPAVSFTSSIFLLLAPVYIKRSTLGWYDNDPYNIFFPLLVIFIIFKIIDSRTKPKLSFLLCLSLIATFMLYSVFWQGWVFMFSVTMIALCLIAGYEKLIHPSRGSPKYFLKTLSLTAIGSFIGISLIFGIKDFFILFKEGWIALKNFLNPQLANWPDLYITVGELKKTNFTEFVNLLGGDVFFIVSTLGIAIIFIHSLITKKTNTVLKLGFILLFLGSSIFITLGAQRFGLILLLPLSISFAITLEQISHILENKIPKKFNFSFKILLSICIFLLNAFPIVHIQRNIQKYLNPIFNSTWEAALLDIKARTPQNSIINTWWPPGHFVKSIAERQVTFDGASINVPQSYWLSKILLSQDETAAVGLLRMLNSSANKAADFLIKEGLPTSKTIEVLNELTKHPKTISQILALKIISDPEKSKTLTDLTHGSPNPSYILLYNEFVENNIQLKFVADWNFKQIEEINKDPKKIAAIPKHNSQEYLDFLWKLNGGMHKYSGPKAELKREGTKIIFEDDITLDLNSLISTVYSAKFGKGVPLSVFLLDSSGDVREYSQSGGRLPYSIAFTEEQGKYTAYLMDRHIAKSMLMQMYLFDAKGLNAIQHFGTYEDLTKRTVIKVFEVNWN